MLDQSSLRNECVENLNKSIDMLHDHATTSSDWMTPVAENCETLEDQIDVAESDYIVFVKRFIIDNK